MKLKTLPPLFRTPPPRVQSSDSLPKITEPFYKSADHKAFAKAVKARAGGVCAHCGKSTNRLIADHVIEIKDGGSRTDPGNGIALCWSCHGLKTAKAKRRRLCGV